MINQEYFNENEKNDYQKLLNFNEETRLFSDLIPISGCQHFDASGVTMDGRGARIELKTRLFSIKKYDTLFVEDHKSANLLYDYLCLGDEPLYINFLDDGTMIFNLRLLTKRPELDTKRTKSGGYGCWEYSARNSLHVVDAAVYDTNNVLIQRPAWRNKHKDS